MRVLVTGAAGFAGRHAAAELARRGAAVTGLDRLPSPPGHPASRWVVADLASAADILRAVGEAVPEAVLHLAAQPRVGASFGDAAGTLRVNAGGTLCLLEAVRRAAPAARVIVVSSCEVYGAVPEGRLPIREDEPLRPASPYAASKCAAELMARAWHHTHGVRAAILRPFTHTGPGQATGFVCADFARQVALAEAGRIPATIVTGLTTPVREFLDVRDVAAAYADALERGLPDGGAFNVASGRGVSVREMLDTLRAMARRPLTVQEDPARHRPGDVPAFVGDPSKLRAHTGWAPQIGLRQTLSDLLDDMRARVAAGTT
jgi:GDP-4-dehydro-6-deoxy-D-mannose reductase